MQALPQSICFEKLTIVIFPHFIRLGISYYFGMMFGVGYIVNFIKTHFQGFLFLKVGVI
jgi:hypothetical protein